MKKLKAFFKEKVTLQIVILLIIGIFITASNFFMPMIFVTFFFSFGFATYLGLLFYFMIKLSKANDSNNADEENKNHETE